MNEEGQFKRMKKQRCIKDESTFTYATAANEERMVSSATVNEGTAVNEGAKVSSNE